MRKIYRTVIFVILLTFVLNLNFYYSENKLFLQFGQKIFASDSGTFTNLRDAKVATKPNGNFFVIGKDRDTYKLKWYELDKNSFSILSQGYAPTYYYNVGDRTTGIFRISDYTSIHKLLVMNDKIVIAGGTINDGFIFYLNHDNTMSTYVYKIPLSGSDEREIRSIEYKDTNKYYIFDNQYDINLFDFDNPLFPAHLNNTGILVNKTVSLNGIIYFPKNTLIGRYDTQSNIISVGDYRLNDEIVYLSNLKNNEIVIGSYFKWKFMNASSSPQNFGDTILKILDGKDVNSFVIFGRSKSQIVDYTGNILLTINYSQIQNFSDAAISNDNLFLFMIDCYGNWTKYNINYSPSVTINSPYLNESFSENSTAFTSVLSVTDADNDILTCKYYIDNETIARDIKIASNTSTAKTVTFNPLDMSTLSEGTHTLKCEINDGKAPSVFSTVSFKVDKTLPTIGLVTRNSIVNNITISGSATDGEAGLDALPYRYTIGTNQTSWMSSQSYTQESLTPNTQYSVTFEARDVVGHIASSSQNVYTKAQIPSLSVNNPKSQSIDLRTLDDNPDVTQYQLSINNGQFYVTPEGGLTTSPVWRTLTGKTVTITGLTPSTSYSIKAKARNQEGIETDWSAPVSGATLIPPPAPPTELTATATTISTTVNWLVVAGATGYDLEADGNIIDTGLQTTYTHTGLTPDTHHTYRVRAKNEGGAGEWSNPITKSTLPNAPITPTNLTAIPSVNSITVMWHAVVGATAYELEVDGVKLNNGGGTNYLHTGLQPNTYHTYKVRAINSGGKSDWTEEVGAVTKVDAPRVPGNITTMPTHTQITVSWDAVDGATYDIEVDGIAKYNAANTTYVHTGLLPGTEHTYRVRAKQSGTPGEWSQLVTVSTVLDAFGIPANLEAQVSNNQVSLSWEPVTSATGYEVEIDGLVLDNGSETSCVHDGVTPNTQYTYRVRAKNAEQTSAWSTPLSVSTYLLPIPQNLSATATDTSFTATWEAVEGATRYVIEFDGAVIESIEATTYQFHGLSPVSQHKLRVRAQNDEGMSAWTNLLTLSTIGNGYNPPEKVTCVARNTALTVLWSEAPGATAYDLEVDGVLMEGITATTYLQENLVSGTPHTYRIRAVYEDHTSGWTELLETQTIPYAPDAPTHVAASAKMTAIAVSWDAIDNVTDYELEVDGNIVQNGIGTTYLHESLQPDSEHTYRVRTRNLSGTSPWSEPVTTQTLSSTETYTVDCTEGEVFNFVFTASNLKNLENYTFAITYDPNQLELIDLCSTTPKLDTGTGNITGTDIYIAQVTPGTLVIKKLTPIPPSQVWSGIVDSIKFRSKTSTQATLTYSIN